MKKVRFESPNKRVRLTMEASECHSPRPFIEKLETNRPKLCYGSLSSSPSTSWQEYPRLLPYNPDPVHRFECSNTSPYPLVAKSNVDVICDPASRWPSNDLELSMLDSVHCEPRQPMLMVQQKCVHPPEHIFPASDKNNAKNPTHILSSIENTKAVKPAQENNFFIKRDNLKMYSENNTINPLLSQLNRLSLGKENDPMAKKAELMRMAAYSEDMVKLQKSQQASPVAYNQTIPDECRCHHCVKIIQKSHCNLPKPMNFNSQAACQRKDIPVEHCSCMQIKQQDTCLCHQPVTIKQTNSCNSCNCQKEDISPQPRNAVDKKAWMIEKYEQNKTHENMELEKQNAVTKDKREPTVADLFKIIKLQNEQLQLLQEKVDKFISASTKKPVTTPIQNYVTEHVALETVDSEQHKISIGVMTSFEMVRTSTVINKEIVTQTNENAQIQCNRSQISIKEVVSKAQPMNFLDGIMPRKTALVNTSDGQNSNFCDTMQQTDNQNDDKTLNELSLYNVQVDNATTPLISPEQSLYLDVRDYSDSESGSDDQSNVGWTYYNKVMTHVNGVLQDSEMPSSASALFRNTKQQCLQMQIDKTNVSVTKRVKFGDDPIGIHQPHIYAAATDTSLKMNQLAAKYLKSNMTPVQYQVPVHKPSAMPIEMSFATRNYMERHRILQGTTVPSRSPPSGEIPRFLDITALKQQTKLL